MDLRVDRAQKGLATNQIVSSLVLIKTDQLTVASLVAKASDEVQQGRHYDKTLEELDQRSLVRDRGGPIVSNHRDVAEGDGNEEEENEEEELPEDEPDHVGKLTASPARPVRDEGPKTDRQHALEAEWGLYRSPAVSQQSPVEEEGDTDDERKHDSPDLDEEDFMVSYHSRLKPVIWTDHCSLMRWTMKALPAPVRRKMGAAFGCYLSKAKMTPL